MGDIAKDAIIPLTIDRWHRAFGEVGATTRHPERAGRRPTRRALLGGHYRVLIIRCLPGGVGGAGFRASA